jgi:hypothetical protein
VADKDFVIKNGLVVGDTATINGVQIDPSGATSGQFLKFDGSKFVPGTSSDSGQSISYEETIGNNSATSFTVTHNLGTKDLNVIVRQSETPYDVVDVRWEATTPNTVTLDFSSAPGTDSKRVIIKGPGTKEYYSQTIGDGSNTVIVVNHNLGSRNIVPVLRNVNSPYEAVQVLAQATTVDSVTFDFSSAPDSSSLLASVYLLDVSNSSTFTIGDGSTTEFTVTHNLNTRDIGVTCRATGSPYDFISVRWEALTVNTAKVIFSSAPATNSRRIGVYKSVGGSKDFNAEFSLIDGDVTPALDNVYSLGTAELRWKSVSIGSGTLCITDSGNNNQVAITVSNGVFNIDGIAQAQLPNVAVTNLTFNDNTVQTTAARGIPNGGSTGQVLSKTNGTDYNVQWSNVPAATLDNVSDVVITSAQNGQLLEFDGTNWVNAVRPSSEPIGHENKADSVISFNEGTRTFSIAPASTSFTVWCAGKRFVKTTTETVQIPDTSGLYYIYYNSSGVLSYRTTFFVWDTDAPTAYVYWNEVDNKAYFFADERHGVTLDWATHEYLHRTRGAAIANGFGANNYILNGNGSSDTHAKIDIADGTFFDEDLQVDITHSATPTANTWEQVLQGNAEIPVFYRLNNHWKKDVATEFPLKQGTNRPQYNLNTAGTWSTEDVQNNHFGVSWIIATNNLNEPVIAILGQDSYSNNGSAQAEFYTALNLDGFPIVEFRPLYKIIYECKNSYTNTPSARITDVIDLRSIISSDQGVGTTPVSDHGSMTGLSDDDHTQYLTDARHDALDHSTAMSTVALDDIGDVTAPSPTSGDFLKWNGTAWVNDAINLGTDTVGDYISSLVAGTGITLSNNSGEGATPTITVNTSVIAALDSPTLTGTPLAPTAANTTNNTQIATTAYVKTVINDLINSAPSTLDTLGEIATSLANNASLSSSLTSSIALKAPLADPTFTGTVTLPANTSIGNVTSTEIGYVDGVTSAIQTQLNAKASTGKAIAMAIVFGG